MPLNKPLTLRLNALLSSNFNSLKSIGNKINQDRSHESLNTPLLFKADTLTLGKLSPLKTYSLHAATD
ncbi:hypothetical protein ACCD10_27780 [Pseudomonas sp. Pseusp122]|uniref:hypothetical protein n=1 Tax=unclassified Pseudomonas TaxID=196821 RepID=UPI0039A4DFEF